MKVDPNLFLQLAAERRHFPIGTDLVLREDPNHEEILMDGLRMARVMSEAADRYGSPLALPVMDLQTEKTDLVHTWFGVPIGDCPAFHLDAVPGESLLEEVRKADAPLSPRLHANVAAVRAVATAGVKVPCGMVIGPFSLATKLIASPIEPAFLFGMGMGPEDEEEVALLVRALELSLAVIERSLRAQIAAGAQVIFIAEPAANISYLSPKQIEDGSDVFGKLVIEPNQRLAEICDRAGVLRIFHCCGEINERILGEFCGLKPSVLSLGSSRDLAADAALVPSGIVLYGNLPSKRFYSDDLLSLTEVREMALELNARLMATGRPYLLGTECDVLSVPGCERTLMEKVLVLREV